MNSFQFSFQIPSQEPKIEIGKSILFIGSCFSDEIGNQAQLHGLKAFSNPFGTLFHPYAIGQGIIDSLEENTVCEVIQQDDVFFHWGSSGKLFAYSKEELESKVIAQRKNMKEQLQNTSHLFVTFGTAKGYFHKTSNQIVANCHKQHPSLFEIQTSNSAEIIQFWKPILERLVAFNPTIQIIFTVSPVRHLKDGIIENNRSKALLLLAVETLAKLQNCHYFPSYEIMMDELRDYRFYKNDFAHPNELAIEYVWHRFTDTYLSNSTQIKCNKIKAIKKALNHKPLYEKSIKKTELQEIILERKNQLDKEIIGINW
jgi:hypothetical protein